MKIKSFVKDIKIFFITFILLCVTGLSFLLQRDFFNMMDNQYYPLYVINYNCGYCSRLLVGTVFSLFLKDTLNVDVLSCIMLGIYFLFCFCLSVFINNYLRKTDFDTIGIYTVFMILCPAFTSLLNYFGTVDIFWFFCVMGALAVVNKKGWRWLVPVFCIIGLAIHEVFLTTYLPVIAIAVLYQFVKKPCASSFIFVAVCTVVVGFASVYFLILGDGTMKMTADEMVRYAQGRLDEKGKGFNDFYLRSAFFWDVSKWNGAGNEVYNNNFIGYLQYSFDEYIKNDISQLKSIAFFALSDLLASIPFVYLFARALRTEKNILYKIIYLFALVPVPLLFIQLFVSSDTERFSMHWLIVMLFMLLFFVKGNAEAFRNSYNDIKIKAAEHKISLALFGIAVARIVFSGVRF